MHQAFKSAFRLGFAAVSILAASNVAAQNTDTRTTQDEHDRAFSRWQFQNLKDPDSVMSRRTTEPFRTTVRLKKGMLGKKEWIGDIACYTMNAKNSYGAYAGYTPYAVLITTDNQEMVFEGMTDRQPGEFFRTYGQQIIDEYC